MAKQVKEGSLVLILVGSNEGETAIVDRVKANGDIRARVNRGKDAGKVVLASKGNYKVI